MQIDFAATRHNMRLIRLARYAAERGITLPLLDRVLRGKYPWTSGEKYKHVIDTLRADGYLVEIPDDDAGSMAA